MSVHVGQPSAGRGLAPALPGAEGCRSGGIVRVTVELLGLARRLAGQSEVQLQIPEGATFRDIVALLADRFPSLLGQVIVPETYDLISPYFFNIGGRLAASGLDATVDGHDPLVLMSLEAGG